MKKHFLFSSLSFIFCFCSLLHSLTLPFPLFICFLLPYVIYIHCMFIYTILFLPSIYFFSFILPFYYSPLACILLSLICLPLLSCSLFLQYISFSHFHHHPLLKIPLSKICIFPISNPIHFIITLS